MYVQAYEISHQTHLSFFAAWMFIDFRRSWALDMWLHILAISFPIFNWFIYKTSSSWSGYFKTAEWKRWNVLQTLWTVALYIHSRIYLTRENRQCSFLIKAVWVVSCLARAGQGMDLSTTAKIQITKENESRCREETMDIFGVKKDAKRSFLCRDRREFGVLQSTLGDLRKDNETRIRHYEDDMRNLQWALYNLRLEQTGKNGKLVPEKTSAFGSMKWYLLILPSLEVKTKFLQKASIILLGVQ